MKKSFSEILAYYEDFKSFNGCFKEGTVLTDYVAPSSLHSDITSFAYGKVKGAKCVDISKGNALEVLYTLKKEDIEERHFYIKLTACLFDWTAYINDLSIAINGKEVYENKREFFENVNLGWPTLYIPVSADELKVGENKVCISTKNTSGGGLMVERADLVSLPVPKEGAQLSLRRSARAGEVYTIAFLSRQDSAEVVDCINCRVVDVIKPKGFEEQLLIQLVSDEVCEASCKVVFADGTETEAALPKIVEASKDICYVGTDSDDHRHDDTDETNRIINIFAMEAMGSYFQIRPQYQRNYFDLSCKDKWKERVDYLRAFGTKFSISDGSHVMDWLPELAQEDYIGSHVHEPYLYFYTDIQDFDPDFAKQMLIDKEALLSSESFGQSRKMFEEVLRKTNSMNSARVGLASVGSPSMLCVYEAAAGFDRVTMEPVSNLNILLGAVRGTAPKMWGSHVPVDWYFGTPNDLIKARKFMVAMQLLYINGADYIYTENAIFKTNAFSREDWDDEFCTKNREYLRDFYDYTINNPREGELVVDQAVVYGNNEYFMWQYDDRMGELGENHDWDIKIWGKWENNEYQKCWRGIDAWLPRAENQNTFEDAVNKYLFSGTPYGATDIIPYESDYKKYRSLAFLGWNTWEDSLADKLMEYVDGGGHLFIGLCHFNKTDRCDMPMEFADKALIKAVTGVEITDEEVIPTGMVTFNDGQTIEITSPLKIRKCAETDAEIIARDDKGNGIVYKKQTEKGAVYFGAFGEYFAKEWGIAVVQKVLKMMGEENARAVCDNPNIAFTVRNQEDGSSIVDIVNVNSADDEKVAQKYNITLNKNGEEKKINGEVYLCSVERVRI